MMGRSEVSLRPLDASTQVDAIADGGGTVGAFGQTSRATSTRARITEHPTLQNADHVLSIYAIPLAVSQNLCVILVRPHGSDPADTASNRPAFAIAQTCRPSWLLHVLHGAVGPRPGRFRFFPAVQRNGHGVGVAPGGLDEAMDSRVAVPDMTSSTISTRPCSGRTDQVPPSPWSLASLRL